MLKKIENKERFQSMGTSFAITLPSGTYTLYQSADGEVYYPYGTEITGEDTLVVNGIKSGMFFYIEGLTEPVNVLL